jgi:signal transduction histidine kinase
VKVPLRIRGEVVGVVGVTRDVTVEKERERALEELVRARTAELERSVASLEELLYTIAHDLRAPNRAMNGYAALLLAEYGAALTEEARGYLGRIRAASVRNDQLIHDLLAYGRLAHAAVRPEPVDVAPLVEEVRAKLGPDVEARRGQVSVAPELPCMLASAEFLKEILRQLLENAVRHGGAPPIVRVEGEDTGATAVVRIIDAGPGIPEDQQERVFDPFTRLPATTDVTGTGMGLAIVRRAVERMKGRVGVVSHPGGGSCFWFELPSGHRGGGDARVVRG